MPKDNLNQILADYVATWNSGKYKTQKELNSKFPEIALFKNKYNQALADYVATWNSGKYKTQEEINSKFPEIQEIRDILGSQKKNLNQTEGQQLENTTSLDLSKYGQPSSIASNRILAQAPQRQAVAGSEITQEQPQLTVEEKQKLSTQQQIPTKTDGYIWAQPQEQSLPELSMAGFKSNEKALNEALVENYKQGKNILDNMKVSREEKNLATGEAIIKEGKIGETDDPIIGLINIDNTGKTLEDNGIYGTNIQVLKNDLTEKYKNRIAQNTINEYIKKTKIIYPNISNQEAQRRLYEVAIKRGIESLPQEYRQIAELNKQIEDIFASVKSGEKLDADDIKKITQLDLKRRELTNKTKLLEIYNPITGELIQDKGVIEQYNNTVLEKLEDAKQKYVHPVQMKQAYLDAVAAYEGLKQYYETKKLPDMSFGSRPEAIIERNRMAGIDKIEEKLWDLKSDVDATAMLGLVNGVDVSKGFSFYAKEFYNSMLNSMGLGAFVATDSPRVILDNVKEVYDNIGKKPQQELSDAIERNFGEHVAESAGGIVPVIISMATAKQALGAVGLINWINNVAKTNKALGFALNLMLEEALFQAVLDGKGGVGAGFYSGSAATGALLNKFNLGNPLFKGIMTAFGSGLGGVVGEVSGEALHAAWAEATEKDTFKALMNQYFGDLDDYSKRIAASFLVFSTLGVGNGVKAYKENRQLEFNKPEVLEKTAEKLDKKGFYTEAQTMRDRSEWIRQQDAIIEKENIVEEERKKNIAAARKGDVTLTEEQIQEKAKIVYELRQENIKKFNNGEKTFTSDEIDRIAEQRAIFNFQKKNVTQEFIKEKEEVMPTTKDGKNISITEIEQLPQEQQNEIDVHVKNVQRKNNLPKQADLFIDGNTIVTIEKLYNGEPVTNEYLKNASDNLYNEYKRLEVMKNNPNRMFTVEQIERQQEFITDYIIRLENAIAEQKMTGRFIGEKQIDVEEGAEPKTEQQVLAQPQELTTAEKLAQGLSDKIKTLTPEEEQKPITDDSKDKTGLPSEVQRGETPIETKPDEKGGEEKTNGDRVFQEAQEEVAVPKPEGEISAQPTTGKLPIAGKKTFEEQVQKPETPEAQAEAKPTGEVSAQPVTKGISGKTNSTKFSSDIEQSYTYKLIEADDLQASHLASGERNPDHTIATAQPKERNDMASKIAQDKIMQNPNFAELSESPNAYFGAPIVNERGEVIQGNNRSIGIKKHYANNGTKYKSDIVNNAEKYGFTKEQVEGMKNPVLVREVKIDDATAIRFGNMDVKDLETGGKQRIDPITTSRKMEAKDKSLLSNIVFGEGKPLKEAIRDNQREIIDIIKKYLNPAQSSNTFNKDGRITAKGMTDIEEIINNFLFDNGASTLPEVFSEMPDVIQKGLQKALRYIHGVENGLLPETQNALLALYEFKKSGIEKIDNWAQTSDIFKETKPSDVFTQTEISLAKKLNDAKIQSDVVKIYKEFMDNVSDKPETLFAGAEKGMSKKEAIEKQFKVKDYEETNKSEGHITTKGKKTDIGIIQQEKKEGTGGKQIEVVKEKEQTISAQPTDAKQIAKDKIKEGLGNITDEIVKRTGGKAELMPSDRIKIRDEFKKVLDGIAELSTMKFEEIYESVKIALGNIKDKFKMSDDDIKGLVDEITEPYKAVPKTEEVKLGTGVKTEQEVSAPAEKESLKGKTKIQKQIDKTVEGKPDHKKELIDTWVEFKRDLKERGKASREGEKQAKRNIKDLQKQFKDWVKANEQRINAVNANLKASILRASEFTTERGMEKAIDFIEKALQNKEYINDVNRANNARKFVKAKAKPKQGKNIFGDNYDTVEQMLQIEPSDLTVSELSEYNSYIEQAVNAIKVNGKAPDIKPIRKILEDLQHRINVPDENIRSIKSFSKLESAMEGLKDIDKIESVKDYQDLMNKAAQVEYHAERLLKDGQIEQPEFDKIIKELNDIYNKSEENELNKKAKEFKASLINEAKNKTVVLQNYSPQKEQAICEFLKIPKDVLMEMSIKDVDSYNRVIDMLNDGVVGSEMYNLKIKANRVIAKNNVAREINANKNTSRFKKFLSLGSGILKEIEKRKSYRLDLEILGSTKNGLYKHIFVPLSDAMIKIDHTTSDVLKEFIPAYKKLKSKLGNKKFEELNRKIGLLYSERDWRSNKVSDKSGEYDWENAPENLKHRFEYAIENNKDNILDADDVIEKNKKVWEEIKKQYSKNGIVDIDEAINDLRKDKSIAQYLDGIDATLSSMADFAQVATENRGKVWDRRNNYFPAKVRESKYKSTPALFEDIDAAIGQMKGTRLSVEAGSTHKRTNKPYYLETDISKIMFNHVREVLTDYYLAPQMKSIYGGLTDAGKATGTSNFTNALKTDITNRMKFELNKQEIDNSEKAFKRLMRYSKYMALAKLDRPIKEYNANMLRALISEGVTPSEYSYANKKAYRNILKESVSDDLLSQYQEEIDNPGKILESRRQRFTKGIITVSDTQIGKLLFAKKFNQKFKEITGEDFNADKYETDINYKEENSEAINSARVDAMNRIEQLFNAKRPLSAPTKVSFFGKNWAKGKTITDLLYYMQSFNQNELEQVKDSMYKIKTGNSREKAQGMRDITSILASNYIYIQSGLVLNAVMQGLIKNAFGDDDDNVRKELENYYNKNMNTENKLKSLASSFVNLATGKNNNIAKALATVSLEMIKQYGTETGLNKDSDFKKKHEFIKEFAYNTYYATTPSDVRRPDAVMAALIPAVGELYGTFTDMGYNVIKIATKPYSELTDETEKYIWDLMNTVNMTISLLYPNPLTPTIDKFLKQKKQAEYKKNQETKTTGGRQQPTRKQTKRTETERR